MIKKIFLSLLIFTVMLTLTPVYADDTATEVVMQSVQKDLPSFKRSPEQELGSQYSIRMVKIRDDLRIVHPPDIKANVLYYGNVTLGSPVSEYGILVDLEGKDKNLWVDADADGDFAEETPYQLFKSDRYTGVNVYYSPLPLVFHITFDLKGHVFQIQMSFDLTYLAVAQSGFKDYFYLRARTWLAGFIEADGVSLQFAIVDANDNGLYNDPDDLIFFDSDYDLNFSIREGALIRKRKTILLKAGVNYQIDYQDCPEKLNLQRMTSNV